MTNTTTAETAESLNLKPFPFESFEVDGTSGYLLLPEEIVAIGYLVVGAFPDANLLPDTLQAMLFMEAVEKLVSWEADGDLVRWVDPEGNVWHENPHAVEDETPRFNNVTARFSGESETLATLLPETFGAVAK